MTVLQKAGWALPMPFLYIHLFKKNHENSDSFCIDVFGFVHLFSTFFFSLVFGLHMHFR
jgi:hypothetical protein